MTVRPGSRIGRYLGRTLLGLGVVVASVGLGVPAAAATNPPPRSVQPFIPTGTRLLGKQYFPALGTLVLWTQQAGNTYPPGLWMIFVQRRQNQWHTVYVNRWAGFSLSSYLTVRNNPLGGESDLIMGMGPGGNDFSTTFLNFVVSPTAVTLNRVATGYSGYITGGTRTFREIFSTYAEQFTWRGRTLVSQHDGVLATIPPGAHVIPVYLYPGQPTPTMLGRPVVHLRAGQPLAMRPATAYALKAFEAGTLAMYGPFPTRRDADPLTIYHADTISGLVYSWFTQPGTYYLDIATSSSHVLVLTVVVSRA